jgi:hypothetical protein
VPNGTADDQGRDATEPLAGAIDDALGGSRPWDDAGTMPVTDFFDPANLGRYAAPVGRVLATQTAGRSMPSLLDQARR